MKNKRGLSLISMGLLLIAAALFLAGYNLYDEHRAERSARQTLNRLGEFLPVETPTEGITPPDEIEIPDYLLNPNMEMPAQNIGGQDYIGIVSIPSLELDLPVISEWSYSRLKVAPCRYKGSAYLGDLIIAAHNYTSHFGMLKRLSEGDEITFTDMDGNTFRYEVVILETLEPTAMKEMESGGWDLTLFTCTVGGAYRMTVRCEQVDDKDISA